MRQEINKNRHAGRHDVQLALSEPDNAMRLTKFFSELEQYDIQIVCLAGMKKRGIGRIENVGTSRIAMRDAHGSAVSFNWRLCQSMTLVQRRGPQPTKLVLNGEAKKVLLELRPCLATEKDFSDAWEMLLLELFRLPSF